MIWEIHFLSEVEKSLSGVSSILWVISQHFPKFIFWWPSKKWQKINIWKRSIRDLLFLIDSFKCHLTNQSKTGIDRICLSLMKVVFQHHLSLIVIHKVANTFTLLSAKVRTTTSSDFLPFNAEEFFIKTVQTTNNWESFPFLKRLGGQMI